MWRWQHTFLILVVATAILIKGESASLKQDKHPRFKSEDRTAKFDASALQAYPLDQSFVPRLVSFLVVLRRSTWRTSVTMTTMTEAAVSFSRNLVCRGRDNKSGCSFRRRRVQCSSASAAAVGLLACSPSVTSYKYIVGDIAETFDS